MTSTSNGNSQEYNSRAMSVPTTQIQNRQTNNQKGRQFQQEFPSMEQIREAVRTAPNYSRKNNGFTSNNYDEWKRDKTKPQLHILNIYHI